MVKSLKKKSSVLKLCAGRRRGEGEVKSVNR